MVGALGNLNAVIQERTKQALGLQQRVGNLLRHVMAPVWDFTGIEAWDVPNRQGIRCVQGLRLAKLAALEAAGVPAKYCAPLARSFVAAA